MKYSIISPLLLILLSACGNEKKEPDTNKTDSIATNVDSSSAKTEVIASAAPTERELFDINWFDINVGDPYLDSLHKALADDPNTEVFVKKEICGGDYCYSYRTIKDKSNHITLHFFKGDAGEYGYDNAQYVLKGNDLYLVRHFDIDMETLDSISAVWRITEKIYAFGPKKVTVKERTASTRNLEVRTTILNKLPFTNNEIDKAELVKSESKQLKEDLERETETD